MRQEGAGTRLFERGRLGAYVAKRQRALLGFMLAKKRGARLLEVNCGQGSFLSLYEELALDVSISEPCPAARAILRENMPRIEIYGAPADHLPLPDDCFDWVVFHPRTENIEKCLEECTRVSRRGLLIAFWNSFSLAAVVFKMSGRGRAWPSTARAVPSMLRLARATSAGRIVCRSILCGPPASWHENSFFSGLNGRPQRVFPGAFCVIGIELEAGGLGTPLAPRVKPNMGEPLGAMEYSQKNFQSCPKDIEAKRTCEFDEN